MLAVFFSLHFLIARQHDAERDTVIITISVRPSVCLSVWLSRGDVVSKR